MIILCYLGRAVFLWMAILCYSVHAIIIIIFFLCVCVYVCMYIKLALINIFYFPTEREILKKLSHKERKKMKQKLEYDRQMASMLVKGGHGTSALDDTFSISQAEKSDKQQSQMENAVDIKVCLSDL